MNTVIAAAITRPISSHLPIFWSISTNPYLRASLTFPKNPSDSGASMVSTSVSVFILQLLSSRLAIIPPAKAVTRAANGRIIANAGPKREYVAAMESTPV